MGAAKQEAITLYGYFRSSTSFRLRLALAYKDLRYDYKPVNLIEKEHLTPEFKQVNPQGLLPALVHNGKVLTQSLAMMEYLDETFPDKPLVFGDAYSRALQRSLAQIIACDIHPMNNLSVWKGYVEKVLGADAEQSKAWYAHWIEKGLRAYEAQMQSAAFSAGYDISIADLCLLPQLYNARRFGVALDDYEKILRVERKLLGLEWVQGCLPEVQKDAPAGLEPVYGAEFLAA